MTETRPDLTVIILFQILDAKVLRAVNSVTWARQILLIQDSDSTVTTKEQLLSTVTILNRPLNGDYAAQRNWALSHVKTEWCLFLDADEWITSDLALEIETAIASNLFNAYRLPRRDYFLGRLLQHGDTGNATFVRLAKTKLGQNSWQRALHEQWQISGRVGELVQPILHQPAESVSHFIQKLQRYSVIESQIRTPLSQSKVVLMMLSFPVAKFLKGYVWQLGCLDGFPGLAHAFCMALFSLMVRVQCWEAWHGRSKI